MPEWENDVEIKMIIARWCEFHVGAKMTWSHFFLTQADIRSIDQQTNIVAINVMV